MELSTSAVFAVFEGWISSLYAVTLPLFCTHASECMGMWMLSLDCWVAKCNVYGWNGHTYVRCYWGNIIWACIVEQSSGQKLCVFGAPLDTICDVITCVIVVIKWQAVGFILLVSWLPSVVVRLSFLCYPYPLKHLHCRMSSDRRATAVLTSETVVRLCLFSLKFCNFRIYLFTGVKWMFTGVNRFCEYFVAYSELN